MIIKNKFGLVEVGLVWIDLVWYKFGMVWLYLVWFGLVWFGQGWCDLVEFYFVRSIHIRINVKKNTNGLVYRVAAQLKKHEVIESTLFSRVLK